MVVLAVEAPITILEPHNMVILAKEAPNTILIHMGIMEALLMALETKEGLKTLVQVYLQLLEVLTTEIMEKKVRQVDMNTMMGEEPMAG